MSPLPTAHTAVKVPKFTRSVMDAALSTTSRLPEALYSSSAQRKLALLKCISMCAGENGLSTTEVNSVLTGDSTGMEPVVGFTNGATAILADMHRQGLLVEMPVTGVAELRFGVSPLGKSMLVPVDELDAYEANRAPEPDSFRTAVHKLKEAAATASGDTAAHRAALVAQLTDAQERVTRLQSDIDALDSGLGLANTEGTDSVSKIVLRDVDAAISVIKGANAALSDCSARVAQVSEKLTRTYAETPEAVWNKFEFAKRELDARPSMQIANEFHDLFSSADGAGSELLSELLKAADSLCSPNSAVELDDALRTEIRSLHHDLQLVNADLAAKLSRSASRVSQFSGYMETDMFSRGTAWLQVLDILGETGLSERSDALEIAAPHKAALKDFRHELALYKASDVLPMTTAEFVDAPEPDDAVLDAVTAPGPVEILRTKLVEQFGADSTAQFSEAQVPEDETSLSVWLEFALAPGASVIDDDSTAVTKPEGDFPDVLVPTSAFIDEELPEPEFHETVASGTQLPMFPGM